MDDIYDEVLNIEDNTTLLVDLLKNTSIKINKISSHLDEHGMMPFVKYHNSDRIVTFEDAINELIHKQCPGTADAIFDDLHNVLIQCTHSLFEDDE
jgi:hypothetical protein